jgi:hypothetical protein
MASVNGTANFVNTRSNMTVFNLTIHADNITANVTGINITLTGNATGGNVSKVFVFNASTSGTLLGTNTSVNANLTSGSAMFVNFSTPLLMGKDTRTGLFVLFEIASNAKSGSTIGGNLTSVGDVVANSTVVANVSLPNSTLATIRDVHANVSISPRFVDTSVANQTFVYTFNITGGDSVINLTISLPSGYTLINITAVERGGTNLTSDLVTNTTLANQINVSLITSTINLIKIYFIVNTSSSSVASSEFNSTMDSVGLQRVATDTLLLNQTNVTTQPILNATDVKILKSTAIVNGTDFWEFNFTLNYTATIPSGGLIQFKLTNWSATISGVVRNLSITNASGDVICGVSNCATLRNEANFNTTNKFNVTNDYESLTKGISVSSTTLGSLVTFTLRMVIPSGTPI